MHSWTPHNTAKWFPSSAIWASPFPSGGNSFMPRSSETFHSEVSARKATSVTLSADDLAFAVISLLDFFSFWAAKLLWAIIHFFSHSWENINHPPFQGQLLFLSLIVSPLLFLLIFLAILSFFLHQCNNLLSLILRCTFLHYCDLWNQDTFPNWWHLKIEWCLTIKALLDWTEYTSCENLRSHLSDNLQHFS